MATQPAVNVVIAGGSGRLGTPTIKYLLAYGFKVSVLTRDPTSLSVADGVETIKADYSSAESLTPCLTGRNFDVMVILLKRVHTHSQLVTMQACVNAQIPRVIPSFFGVAFDNDEDLRTPYMAPKIPILEDVLDKASKGLITYTGLNCGLFFDWSFDIHLFINLAGKPTRLYDGGEGPMSLSTLDDVGRSVVGVLVKLGETKNKMLSFHSCVMTQNQVLRYAAEAAPGVEFPVEQIDSAEAIKVAWQKYNAGCNFREVMTEFAARGSFANGGGYFRETDNALLGITQWSDERLKEEIIQQVKRVLKC
ncbi:uncharacterized protein N7459_001678 [Penicillium hispanicum]|uniref:uncharacterized protein n=1 Tax=Penicillium hispanicum TaxID=1080232 RepID=UPI0025411F30|nr:uncharacterized protein N7459_001678 [Penicillium hispanicum]KAJ5595470.1 hypothetical protein N7459_001678 [Penicillium hispanicum]